MSFLGGVLRVRCFFILSCVQIWGGFSLQEIIVDAMSKKMGRDRSWIFPLGVMILCCFMIYLAKWSSYIAPNLDFPWISSSLRKLPTQTSRFFRCDLLVSGRVWHGCLFFAVVDPGCFGPSCFLVPCWSSKPATIWRRTSEDLTGRPGLEKR